MGKKEWQLDILVCTEARQTASLDTGSHLHNYASCLLYSPTHFPYASTLKVLTVVSLCRLLWVKDYSFQISEAHICFLKSTCDKTFSLIFPFSVKTAFMFIKGNKTKTTSSFITFSAFIFCHSEIFFSFPLSVFFSPSCRQHPAPPVTVLTELQERTLLQNFLWRISYKSLQVLLLVGGDGDLNT